MTKSNQRRVPAEWEPQSAVQLTWPHPATDWATNLLVAEQVFIQITIEILQRQNLLIVCASESHANSIMENIKVRGGDAARINCVIAASNDSWTRDHGPITM